MVERYSPVSWNGIPQLEPSRNGPFVHYSDHEALERELAEVLAKEETWHKLYQQALDRENAITTERDRLAAALTDIAGDVDGTWDEKFRAVQSIARAALAGKE